MVQKVLYAASSEPLDAKPCTLLELTEFRCVFPVGDPQSAQFHYCGAFKPRGVSYCAHHIRIAYTPTSREKYHG